MNRSIIAMKNSIVGLFSQMTSIILQFLTRSVFIKYLGVEMLGLSSTFASVLGALSVAELGFQTAVTYHLYRPIVEDDKKAINDIINIFKLVYRCIGVFFIVASFSCVSLLPYIVKGIEVTNYVRCIFLVQAAGSACTYFLAYKRSLLYADQKAYVSTTIDMIINIIANVLQIITVIATKNYLLYLGIKVAQVYLSNIVVNHYCNKNYPYLHKDKTNKELLKKIVGHVKDIFSSRISSYIYTSTDSLVISAFVGTIQVGFFNNYTMITNNIKIVANSMTNPLVPIIGNIIAAEGNEAQLDVFNLYNYVRYILSGILVLPILCLAHGFITIWIGKEYILSDVILMLLCADLYIHIMHTSCCDYIFGNGLFKIDKYLSIIGAILNLTTSIIFVLRFGVVGVLVGTVTSQIFFWISRSYVTYKYCLKKQTKFYLLYWAKQSEYLLMFSGICFVQKYICSNFVLINNPIMNFIVSGIVCEVLFITISIATTWKMKENKQCRDVFFKTLKDKFRTAQC